MNKGERVLCVLLMVLWASICVVQAYKLGEKHGRQMAFIEEDEAAQIERDNGRSYEEPGRD